MGFRNLLLTLFIFFYFLLHFTKPQRPFACWLLWGSCFHSNEQITYVKFHCHAGIAYRIVILSWRSALCSTEGFGSQQETATANIHENDMHCNRLTPISALKSPNYSGGDASLLNIFQDGSRWDIHVWLTGRLSNLIWVSRNNRVDYFWHALGLVIYNIFCGLCSSGYFTRNLNTGKYDCFYFLLQSKH